MKKDQENELPEEQPPEMEEGKRKQYFNLHHPGENDEEIEQPEGKSLYIP